jgi:hypothetical protein
MAESITFGGSAHSPRRWCAEPSQSALIKNRNGWNQLWQQWGLLRMAPLQHCRIISASDSSRHEKPAGDVTGGLVLKSLAVTA